MTTVGAYIELKPWETAPLHSLSCWAEGELEGKTLDGIEVTWWDSYPEGAQVYIEWNPRVYAVWEEENEGSNGVEVGGTGEDDAQESDEGA